MGPMASGRPAVGDDEKRVRGERVLALRERVWGTQQKGADAIGIDRSVLSRWEGGGHAFTTSEPTQKIAEALAKEGYAVGPLEVRDYIFGAFSLGELLAKHQADGREVFDASDPRQWAALVRAHGQLRNYDPETVEAFIGIERKGSQLTRIDQIPIALDAFVRDVLRSVNGGVGTAPQSDKPPFLAAKKSKKSD